MIKKIANIVLFIWFISCFVIMVFTTGEGPLWPYVKEMSETSLISSILFMIGVSGCPMALAIINANTSKDDFEDQPL